MQQIPRREDSYELVSEIATSSSVPWGVAAADHDRPATQNYFPFQTFQRPSMSIVSPIHRLLPHPASQHIYLASSSSIHKYVLATRSIDNTYTSNTSSFPQHICVSADWIFFTGGEKVLHVLNAHTLESVASLYISLFPLLLSTRFARRVMLMV